MIVITGATGALNGSTVDHLLDRVPVDEVAVAVLRAIEQDRAELDVAPVAMRLGAAVAQLAPQLSARVSARLGADVIAGAMAAAQTDKR